MSGLSVSISSLGKDTFLRDPAARLLPGNSIEPENDM
jgi:hypothetical protein